jgi:hypothetical protein
VRSALASACLIDGKIASETYHRNTNQTHANAAGDRQLLENVAANSRMPPSARTWQVLERLQLSRNLTRRLKLVIAEATRPLARLLADHLNPSLNVQMKNHGPM